MPQKYYWENKFSVLEYKRAYRFANIEKVRAQERAQHIKHKEKRNAYNRDYYYANIEKIRARNRAYYHERKKSKC